MTYYADLVKRMRGDGVKAMPDHIRVFVEAAADAIEALVKQFPEGMEGRKIIFSECSKGHGKLRGENWVENPCQICRAEAAEAEAVSLSLEAAEAEVEMVNNTRRELEGEIVELSASCKSLRETKDLFFKKYEASLAEVEKLKEALTRLGSNEAFYRARIMSADDAELIMRIDFARRALECEP